MILSGTITFQFSGVQFGRILVSESHEATSVEFTPVEFSSTEFNFKFATHKLMRTWQLQVRNSQTALTSSSQLTSRCELGNFKFAIHKLL